VFSKWSCDSDVITESRDGQQVPFDNTQQRLQSSAISDSSAAAMHQYQQQQLTDNDDDNDDDDDKKLVDELIRDRQRLTEELTLMKVALTDSHHNNDK